MVNISSISLLFMFNITLHNIEEGLWLPQWSQYAKKYHKPVEKGEFHFALIIITALAYLAAGLFMFFPEVLIIKYIFVGCVGMMILNVFLPHLAATIVLRRYAPGLITGILLNLPLNSLIIIYMIKNKLVNPYQAVLSTVIVAIVILSSLSMLFKVGRKLVV